VKHAHHQFDTDLPGKDSYKLRKAGDCEMLVASAKRWALVHESPERKDDPVLEELLPYLSLGELDLVLVEGFKDESLPKIELHRPSLVPPMTSVVEVLQEQDPWLFPETHGPVPNALLRLPAFHMLLLYVTCSYLFPVDQYQTRGVHV
jgi:molybdopterin-guanine dinucleotide biosynthesis protein MobB